MLDSLSQKNSERKLGVAKHNGGYEFFSTIYGKHTDRILNNMNSSHPLLGKYAIEHIYHGLLADFGVLSPLETSLAEVICCVSAAVEAQAKGHVHGARNLHVTDKKLGQIVGLVFDILSFYNVPHAKEVTKWDWWSKFNVGTSSKL